MKEEELWNRNRERTVAVGVHHTVIFPAQSIAHDWLSDIFNLWYIYPTICYGSWPDPQTDRITSQLSCLSPSLSPSHNPSLNESSSSMASEAIIETLV